MLKDQISGRMAKAYFMEIARQEGTEANAIHWDAICRQLMLFDLYARECEPISADGTTVVYRDLGYTTIRDYHARVFSTLGGTVPPGRGVSIKAWTPFASVEILGETLGWEFALRSGDGAQFPDGAVLAWLGFFSQHWSGTGWNQCEQPPRQHNQPSVSKPQT